MKQQSLLVQASLLPSVLRRRCIALWRVSTRKKMAIPTTPPERNTHSFHGQDGPNARLDTPPMIPPAHFGNWLINTHTPTPKMTKTDTPRIIVIVSAIFLFLHLVERFPYPAIQTQETYEHREHQHHSCYGKSPHNSTWLSQE